MRGIIAKHRGIIALSSDMARSWDCIFHAWQCARPPTNLIIVLSCYSVQVRALIGSQGSVFACERGGASLLYTGASLLVHGGALMPLWSSIDAPSVSAPESFPASPRWVALPKVMPRRDACPWTCLLRPWNACMEDHPARSVKRITPQWAQSGPMMPLPWAMMPLP